MDAAQGRDPEDFEWQKQARFYWRHDFDHAQTSIADVDFKYLGVKEPRGLRQEGFSQKACEFCAA